MDMEDENKTETQEKPQELTEDFFSNDYTGDYESDNDSTDSTQNENSPEESETDNDDKNDNDAGEDSDDADILNAEEQEKGDPVENEGSFLNRNMLFVITGGVFILFLFFAVFVLPELTKRKEVKTNELDKAGKIFIPDDYEEDVLEDDPEPRPDFSETNSAKDSYLEDFDTSIPNIDNNRTAPVEVPDKMATGGTGSTQNSVPQTNRNELQKPLQYVPFGSDYASGGYQNGGYKSGSQTTGYGYTQRTSGGYGYGGTTTQSYTPQALQSNIGAYLASQNTSSYDRQNNQSGKEKFMNRSSENAGSYTWNSDYSLWKGTIIPAVLDTGINTDNPGQIIATVTTNIYSSNNGQYLLIPQGSRLFAEYNSSISYGQNRVQVVWNTLIRPDGLEINLGSMNGVDSKGYSGYAGWKTEHPFEYAKALGLIAMFSILDTKAANTINAQDNMYAQNALSDAYSEARKLNEKIIDRALDIQPTIRIKSGTPVKLITNITMDLPPLEPYPVEQKYVRN